MKASSNFQLMYNELMNSTTYFGRLWGPTIFLVISRELADFTPVQLRNTNQSSSANMCQPISHGPPHSPPTNYLGIAPYSAGGPLCNWKSTMFSASTVPPQHCALPGCRPLLEDFLASCDYVGALVGACLHQYWLLFDCWYLLIRSGKIRGWTSNMLVGMRGVVTSFDSQSPHIEFFRG